MNELSRVDDYEVVKDNSNLYMVGGVVLMVAGAALVLMNPFVRRSLGGLGVGALGAGGLLKTLAPDIQRYMKIRAM